MSFLTQIVGYIYNALLLFHSLVYISLSILGGQYCEDSCNPLELLYGTAQVYVESVPVFSLHFIIIIINGIVTVMINSVVIIIIIIDRVVGIVAMLWDGRRRNFG